MTTPYLEGIILINSCTNVSYMYILTSAVILTHVTIIDYLGGMTLINSYTILSYMYSTLHKKLYEFSWATLPGFAVAASCVGFTCFAINWRAVHCDIWSFVMWIPGHLMWFIYWLSTHCLRRKVVLLILLSDDKCVYACCEHYNAWHIPCKASVCSPEQA